MSEALEFLKSVPELVDAFKDVLNTPYGWVIVFFVFLWLVVNKDLNKVADFLQRGEKRRLSMLDDFVAKPDLAEYSTVYAIKDIRDAYYFKVATGVYAEKSLRLSLIDLHGATSHAIDWVTIKFAMEYIRSRDDASLYIREQTAFEKFAFMYNELSVYAMLLCACFLVLLVVVVNVDGWWPLLIWLFSVAFCVGIAAVASRQNRPFRSARMIKAELLKLEAVQKQQLSQSLASSAA